MQHCKRNAQPINSHQGTYVRVGSGDLWEEQAQHGYRSGIALALHLPAGRHLLVGVDRDEAFPGDSEHCWRQAAELLLFASCAEGVATRLLVPGGALPLRLGFCLRAGEKCSSGRWRVRRRGRLVGSSPSASRRSRDTSSMQRTSWVR